MIDHNKLQNLLTGSSDQVAKRLLGCWLVRHINETVLIGKIVETEAYDEEDPASHSFRGITKRTKVMFGPPGFLYVYFTYGMHYCCNVVCGNVGHGSAVLIRAVEPLQGLLLLSKNRNGKIGKEVSNGPAKVCQAFSIDLRYNGHNLLHEPLQLIPKPKIPDSQIKSTTRIGISSGKDKLLRYYILGNEFVSRPL